MYDSSKSIIACSIVIHSTMGKFTLLTLLHKNFVKAMFLLKKLAYTYLVDFKKHFL